MAEQLLYCAGCNASFKAKSYDANKTYPCPKCKQPLRPKGEADTSTGGVTLDTQGKARTDEGRDPLVGTTIASYKIVRKLGQGGMGSVYEAKHLELGRSVALKILSPKLAAEDPDSVERFKREARAAAVLEHPNVVTTHAVGSDGDHHFIELQLIDGESLQARVQREKGLPVAEATRIILGAARALGAGHEQNIVHRDIKPGNIMLTKKRGPAGAAAGGREWGHVKVMDFGLAKDVTSSAQLTMSGHIMGTPHYMSPEQCDGLPLDGRADIYSLGATYYAILTGQTPYQGTSLLGILRQQADAPIPNVREKRPDVPARVQQVIEKAMAKKPEDRFQTMEELVAALAQVGSAVGGAAPAAATQTVKAPVHTEAETLAATLSDVMDADEERERHLHTARIRSRIKEVEAFVGVWKDLAKAAAVARKAGQASEKDESEFAKLRDSIHKQYASILKRLGNPGSPGQRVISACDTGVTLTSIVQMADADYQDLSYHIQAGAKVLYDYMEFLEDGRQGLLKQSTWYFYWDKFMHNPKAAAAALAVGVVLTCVIGWKVAAHWPKGEKTPTTEVTESTEKTELAHSAIRTPQSAIAAASSLVDPASGQPKSFTNPTDDSEMIYVPAGTFKMGGNLADNEKPIHDVSVGSFYIGRYEVTNKQFKKFVDANPQWRKGRVDHSFYLNHWQGDTYPSDTADHPVACVSWFAAKAYCEWADGRLPTEAEWEYACRAGSTTKYCFGDDESKLGDYAWYRSNSDKRTHPIGGKEPNRWGIHGMHGNVWEWCSSIRKDYPYRANDGREDLNETGSHRVVRGGGWGFNLPGCRSAYRCDRMPTDCYFLPALGFRVCVSSRVPKAAGAAEPSALAAQSATSADPLPPGLGRSFMLPDSDKDQHANPVVVRNGSRVDPKTGWPYEIWVREPRLELVLIPAGDFLMGSPQDEEGRDDDEGPVHRVRITRPFYIGKYETTVGQFASFVRDTGYKTDPEERGGGKVLGPGKKWKQRRDANWRKPYHAQSDAHPVTVVSWSDAVAFCRWLSGFAGVEIRLPTEAQWEHACRAGTRTRFHYGDDEGSGRLSDYAWYVDNSGGKLHPVGRKPPSPWGLFDMHGSAGEWCLDVFDRTYYSRSSSADPEGPSKGNGRVVRGGCWLDEAKYARSANRSGVESSNLAYASVGFRCVAVPPCSQDGLTPSVPDNFAYGYFYVSPETYQDFEKHVARVAPYTNVAVTHKQHLSVAMPALARFGIKALIRGFKPHSRDPKKVAESFRKALLPVWRKHREHILAVYLVDEPYGVQGGKANMTPTELRDLVKQCKKACPKLPVFVNFLVSPDSNFWRQQDPLPEEVDIVGFDHYVRGTADEVRSHTLYSVSSLRRLSRGKPVFICGRSLTGRGKKQAEPSYGPLDPAEADAYKDAAVQAGASGLIWAFYDAEAWSGLHGACFSPSIFPVHERIARTLGVHKLR